MTKSLAATTNHPRQTRKQYTLSTFITARKHCRPCFANSTHSVRNTMTHQHGDQRKWHEHMGGTMCSAVIWLLGVRGAKKVESSAL